MSKFIPKVVNGTLPEVQDGSMIFDKTSKKIYFDFDSQHQEVKSGEEYSAGTGINIDENNKISVDGTIAKSADLTSEVTTARAAEAALQAGKQDKLPNATQIGQVLKATDTEGGIAWGEADGSLVINGTIEFDEETEESIIIVSDEENIKLINAINAGKKDCLLSLSFMPGNDESTVNYIFKQIGVIPEDDYILVIFNALLGNENFSVNFTYKVDLTEKAWITQETYLQKKLPNATQIGQVLKATDTKGGIAWGEAGSGLPSTEDAKTGDALKVQITPAVYKFTTSIVASETPQDFFINTLSDFDFSGLTYDEVSDYYAPVKSLIKFDSNNWGIIATSGTDEFPNICGLYLAHYGSCGVRLEMPLYLASDASSWYGNWTKGWVFDQTDGEWAYYAQEAAEQFPLDSTIPGNISIHKCADQVIIDKVIQNKDLTSAFSTANTTEKVSDITTDFIWDSLALTGQTTSCQFYASDRVKAINPADNRHDKVYSIGLDLTKVPNFSSLNSSPINSFPRALVLTALDSYYSGDWVEGQGLYLYAFEDTETLARTYALIMTVAHDSASTAEDFDHFPLYATSACDFDHEFNASYGQSTPFTYHYSFSGAGWAQSDSYLNVTDYFYIWDLAMERNEWSLRFNLGACISFQQVDSSADFVFYPYLDRGNKFQTLRDLLLNCYENGTNVDDYAYHHSHDSYTVLAFSGGTEDRMTSPITVPVIPELNEPHYNKNSILLSTWEEDPDTELYKKYKWLYAPSTATVNKVLTYNYSTSSVEWADGGTGGGTVIINGTCDLSASTPTINVVSTEAQKLVDAIAANNFNIVLSLTQSGDISVKIELPLINYVPKSESGLSANQAIFAATSMTANPTAIVAWSTTPIQPADWSFNLPELIEKPQNASDGQVLTYATGSWVARDVSVTSMASENVTYSASYHATSNQKAFNEAIEYDISNSNSRLNTLESSSIPNLTSRISTVETSVSSLSTNKQDKLTAGTGISSSSLSGNTVAIDTTDAIHGQVLSYDGTYGKVVWAWAEAEEIPTYNESEITYYYDPCGFESGFDLSDLANNATYKCYYGGNCETVFTIYTDSSGEILHNEAILSTGLHNGTPYYTRLSCNNTYCYVVDYYNGTSWQELSEDDDILRVKRLL